VHTAASVKVLALVIAWTLMPSGSSATEEAAPKIPQAKSYVLTMVQKMSGVSKQATTGKVYWAAPGKSRFEHSDGDELVTTKVSSKSGPGIDINHEYKTYQRLPAQPGSPHMSFFNEKLGRFAGQADRDLGTRQIGDRPASGFEIAMTKLDPDLPPATVRIWVDRQSGLPTEVEYTFERGDELCVMRFEHIRWNVALDPKLFEPVAPPGYVKRRRSLPPMAEQLRAIVKALRIYAELFDGHYPRVTRVQPGVLHDEMFKKVGIPPDAATTEQKRSSEYANVLVATTGFSWFYRIQKEVPDVAYYGKSVEPNDKNKVLARWKLDADKYQVIYGDLRTEAVTPEKLRSLEGTSGPKLSERDGSAGLPADQSSQEKVCATMPSMFLYRVPACHWRIIHPRPKSASRDRPDIARMEEGWTVRELGWRIEVRQGAELTAMAVQTPRWRFFWDVAQNTVSASPSQSEIRRSYFRRGRIDAQLVKAAEPRKELFQRAERARATHVSETERRDGKEVEKVTFQYLADPDVDGDWPIHSFNPEAHLKLLESPDAKFLPRTYWFDAKTHLVAGYRCGCKSTKYEYWVDYPAPESVPRELFTFEVPRDAELTVADPALGRRVQSEGQTEPDPP